MLRKLLAAFAALSLFLLAACGGDGSETTTASPASDSDDWSINEPVVTRVGRDDDKWPLGEHSKGVPKPGFGKILVVGEDHIGSPNALITIIITGVTENNFTTYSQQLKIAGFYELEGFGGDNEFYFFGVNDAGKKVETDFVISPTEASGRMRIKIYR